MPWVRESENEFRYKCNMLKGSRPPPSAQGSSSGAPGRLPDAGWSPAPDSGSAGHPLSVVARCLPGDHGGIPSERAGDLAFRQTSMQPGVNLASFEMGQGMVAGRHEHSLLVLNGLPSSGLLQSAYLKRSGDESKCCTLEWHGDGIRQWIFRTKAGQREFLIRQAIAGMISLDYDSTNNSRRPFN